MPQHYLLFFVGCCPSPPPHLPFGICALMPKQVYYLTTVGLGTKNFLARKRLTFGIKYTSSSQGGNKVECDRPASLMS